MNALELVPYFIAFVGLWSAHLAGAWYVMSDEKKEMRVGAIVRSIISLVVVFMAIGIARGVI